MDPVRFSRLKLIARSPAHYAGATVEETLAMERGTAVHSILLGGKRVISYGKARNEKHAEYQQFKADNPDALILTEAECAKANAMAKAVNANRLAVRVLDGAHELETEWRFGQRGCAGRIDVLNPGWVCELKCTVSSDPDKFQWQAMRMGYFAQVAWYMDGVTAAGLAAPELGYIVAVESTPPFPVTVFAVTQRALEQGRAQYRGWFERLRVCEESNEWPPYAQSVVPLDVPEENGELDFSGLEEAA